MYCFTNQFVVGRTFPRLDCIAFQNNSEPMTHKTFRHLKRTRTCEKKNDLALAKGAKICIKAAYSDEERLEFCQNMCDDERLDCMCSLILTFIVCKLSLSFKAPFMTIAAFAATLDQDQASQNVQSDL